jgi:ERCC4-type nuclease
VHIFCSGLPNDQDMIKALGSCAIPCPLFTDCGFWGVNDTGETVLVGIERKKIGDIVACILDGRLMHQAQIAKENGIDVLCVIIEGRIRSNPDDGLLEVPVWGINPRTMHRAEMWQPVRPTMTHSRFTQFLYELTYLAGIQVLRTENVAETASVIRALWDFYQKKPDDHRSLHKIFKRPPPTVNLIRPSLIRRISSELDGIGWEKSRAVEDHFGSVLDMVQANTDEWQKIPGIGKTIASRVFSSIRNGGKL